MLPVHYNPFPSAYLGYLFSPKRKQCSHFTKNLAYGQGEHSLCVSVGCLPDTSSCLKQSLPFSSLCIIEERSPTQPLQTGFPWPWCADFWTLHLLTLFLEAPVPHLSLDHGVSPCPWSTFHLVSLHQPLGLMEKPLQELTLDFSLSDEVLPGALLLTFCTSQKGTVAWTLVMPSVHLSSSICGESTRNASESTPHEQMVFPPLYPWGAGVSLYKVLWSFIWSLSRKQKPELDSWAEKSLFLKDLAFTYFFFSFHLTTFTTFLRF